MKKRFVSLLIAGIMACSLAACGSSPSEAGGTSQDSSQDSSSTKVWTIGYSNRDDTDIFLKAIEDEFVKLVEADDTLKIITADAQRDSQTQLDQLDNFTVQGIDCAVLVPNDGDTVVDYINQCNEDNVPVFCFSQSATGGDFTFVGSSDYELGMLKCQWAYENLPEGAKVLYLGGNSGYQTSLDRRQAVVDGLADRLYKDYNGNVVNEDGDIEVLSWQECMYTMEEGMQITEDWIQTFDDFDAIISVCGRSTLGAIEALQGAGITDCMVISIDGLDDELQAIKDGSESVTVLQSAPAHAQELYDAIKTAQAGGENPKVINPEAVLIDINNVDEFLN